MKGLAFFFGLLVFAATSCRRSDTLFEVLTPSQTGINFGNNLEKKDLFGILYYLYYYNGGGVSIGDINNDGLPDIYFTANSKANNKLYLNKGNLQFEDITEKAGVAGKADWCSGTTMADINGDGYLDIYVCAVNIKGKISGKNELYINNHNNTFTESAAGYGLDFSGFSAQAAFFDYDHDGDLDCYLLNQSHYPNQNIVDTSLRHKTDAEAGDRFYRNELISTSGKHSPVFTDVSSATGIYQSSLGYGLGISVADFNNDGWEDVYIGNDFHENDYYYLNNGNGTFAEAGSKHFGHYSRFSMGNDAADYNNDGQLDIITVDMLPQEEKILKTYGSDENPDVYKFKLLHNGYQYQYSKNCLQRNNGDGASFSETSLLSGVAATDWSWAPLFADFDNDGNKDLLITSGIVKRPLDMDYVRFVSDRAFRKVLNTSDKNDDKALSQMPEGQSHPFLYKGDGKINFTDKSAAWGTEKLRGFSNGASYADLDNDGDLDLVINCINDKALILKNNTAQKNYLQLSFKGDQANVFGIGVKAYAFQHGKMQYQQMMLTRGFESSVEPRLHFAFDTSSPLDSLLVIWPDQRWQILKNIPLNKQVAITQKDASGKFPQNNFFKPVTALFTDISNQTGVNWKHQENMFDDFNVQYLIPHAQSTRGPKIAVADINGDGLDDFYVCGAKGQPGSLMVQQKQGTFVPSNEAVFTTDAGYEDVDALFFDANGDHYADLYVVSGGNEASGQDTVLSDRLYLNDGKGHFTKTTDALPAIFANKSCVTVADIDHDGDKDLFVGTLADANAYGVPQTSYLLLNDGKAHFSIAGQDKMALTDIGMVTSAMFADVNKDGWDDLVMAGEWMPVTTFINKQGRFEKTTVAASSGWWQTVLVTDVNKDGNPDILAGNWGWNNKFHSGKNGPVKLYVKDFDKNGKVDQLMSYTLNGKEYPFLAKDEMERQLPVLKKHYLLYKEYAGLEMKDAFYGFVDTIKPLIAERLGSAVLYGDGKGGFTITDLPSDMQLSPIFAFSNNRQIKDSYLSGGNFFEVIPYEGRYDGQSMMCFSANANGEVSTLHQPSLIDIKNQVRDLKWLHTGKYGEVLIVAGNNSALQFYATQQSAKPKP